MQARPPGAKEQWDDMDSTAQAHMVAYEEIREHEEAQSFGCPMFGG